MPKPTNDKEFTGTFKTAIDLDTVKTAKKGELPLEVPVLPKGEFMTQPYGNMVLDDNVFDQMITNFKNKVRRAVPLDVDHAWENTRAAGWIKGLVKKDDGLWASIDFTPFGEGLVKGREYRMISAEWSFDYVDPQHSTHHGIVLIAATLTNRPLMQSMPTITASDKHLTNPNDIVILFNQDSKSTKTNMPTIAEILAKNPEDRTEDEVALLEEKADELNDEQKDQLEKEGENSNDEGEEKPEGEESEGDDAEDSEDSEDSEDEEEGDEDETVEVKASEIARLREIETAQNKAAELKEATDFAKPFMASDKGGKVLPAGKDALVELSLQLNKAQRKLLASVLKATVDQKVTKVEGEDSEADAETAEQKYMNLVNKFMTKGLTAGQANTKVRKEHKDIYNSYIAGKN